MAGRHDDLETRIASGAGKRAELRFQLWCLNQPGWDCRDLGFRENFGEWFKYIHQLLRKMPDFVAHKPGENFVHYCEVKNYYGVKVVDLMMLQNFQSYYCNPKFTKQGGNGRTWLILFPDHRESPLWLPVNLVTEYVKGRPQEQFTPTDPTKMWPINPDEIVELWEGSGIE
jgi:hypothetical protein